MALPKERQGGFTYADYLTWPQDERWELIDGVAWNMSPAPNRAHQAIAGRAFRAISEITDAGPCEAYIAPFDVRLGDGKLGGTVSDKETTTVVQPDVSVFCNPDLLDDAGAHGPPDLVVEVLSPATSYKDQTEKLALYERHGVREYWVVNGDAEWVMVYHRTPDGGYGKPDYYRGNESIRSAVLEAEIPLSWLFGPKEAS
jgi:Uma2 family endonuclease